MIFHENGLPADEFMKYHVILILLFLKEQQNWTLLSAAVALYGLTFFSRIPK